MVGAMLSLIETLLGKLSVDTGGKVVTFLKVLIEHLVKRHGREIGNCFNGFAGYWKLVGWVGNAARCAANQTVSGVAGENTADCPHPVDPDHGVELDL